MYVDPCGSRAPRRSPHRGGSALLQRPSGRRDLRHHREPAVPRSGLHAEPLVDHRPGRAVVPQACMNIDRQVQQRSMFGPWSGGEDLRHRARLLVRRPVWPSCATSVRPARGCSAAADRAQPPVVALADRLDRRVEAEDGSPLARPVRAAPAAGMEQALVERRHRRCSSRPRAGRAPRHRGRAARGREQSAGDAEQSASIGVCPIQCFWNDCSCRGVVEGVGVLRRPAWNHQARRSALQPSGAGGGPRAVTGVALARARSARSRSPRIR